MSTLRLFALLGVLATALSGQVVINEVVYDDQSTDDREFIELYNAGASPVDISGWTIENVDAVGPSLMGVLAVPAATILPAGGFYVFGNTAVVGANQIIPTNSFENDSEMCILRDSTTAVMDTLTYEHQQQLTFSAAVEGNGFWGPQVSNDAFPQSLSRWFDGVDTNDNGRDFGLLPATPGTSNNIATSALPFADNFDSYLVQAAIPGWGWSFVQPIAIDPTTTSAHNLSVIPASPQGGNAMTVMDPTGGGNHAILTSTPVSDVLFEAYVYMDTTNTGLDYEAWNIGARGSVDTFSNWIAPYPSTQCSPSSVATPFNAIGASGVTGICWNYTWAGGMGSLRLLDAGNGGTSVQTLATIVITPGVNDGWQRLRLNLAGDVVDGIFGGTYGTTNTGTRVLALTNTTGVGSVYVGYRECVLVNAGNLRGPTIDNLTIVAGQTPYSCFLTQPLGSGSVQLDNRGLVPGNETWNIVSFEACPGGPGTGPYLGLCATDFNTLLNQFLLPAGAVPFHFFAASSSFTFGPLTGVPVGLPIDVVTFDVVGGAFNNISPVASIVIN